MSTLIMTVGLPKSGKSTWAKQQNLPIVNPDSIRLAIHGNHFISEAEPVVWLIAKYMVKSLFLAGHDKVILDATNITKKRRDEWISKSWNIDFKLFTNVSIEECLTRAKIDNDLAIEAVIYRMANEYEPV